VRTVSLFLAALRNGATGITEAAPGA